MKQCKICCCVIEEHQEGLKRKSKDIAQSKAMFIVFIVCLCVHTH